MSEFVPEPAPCDSCSEKLDYEPGADLLARFATNALIEEANLTPNPQKSQSLFKTYE
jgi:hypothetical protein